MVEIFAERQKFDLLKNREDGTDLDDFLMKLIGSTRTFFSKKKIVPPKKKIASTRMFASTNERLVGSWLKFPGGRRNRIVIDGYKIDAVKYWVVPLVFLTLSPCL